RAAALRPERRLRQHHGRLLADPDDSVFPRAQTKPPLSDHFRQILPVAPGRARPLVVARLGHARFLFSARLRAAAPGDLLGLAAALRAGAVAPGARRGLLRALR